MITPNIKCDMAASLIGMITVSHDSAGMTASPVPDNGVAEVQDAFGVSPMAASSALSLMESSFPTMPIDPVREQAPARPRVAHVR